MKALLDAPRSLLLYPRLTTVSTPTLLVSIGVPPAPVVGFYGPTADRTRLKSPRDLRRVPVQASSDTGCGSEVEERIPRRTGSAGPTGPWERGGEGRPGEGTEGVTRSQDF